MAQRRRHLHVLMTLEDKILQRLEILLLMKRMKLLMLKLKGCKQGYVWMLSFTFFYFKYKTDFAMLRQEEGEECHWNMETLDIVQEEGITSTYGNL